MTRMSLYSGGTIDFLDPQPEDIHLVDIAQGLSQICRFGGQSRAFLSLAEHSINVSVDVGPMHALQGLMHGAAEAYLGDWIGPLKLALGELGARSALTRLETTFYKAIAFRFGFPISPVAAVHRSDQRALLAEAQWVMPQALELLNDRHGMMDLGALTDQPPMTSEVAKARFLERARDLMPNEDLRTEHVIWRF